MNKHFKELSELEQDKILAATKAAYDKCGIINSKEYFKILYDMANPLIVLERNKMRVHEHSFNMVQLIFNRYI